METQQYQEQCGQEQWEQHQSMAEDMDAFNTLKKSVAEVINAANDHENMPQHDADQDVIDLLSHQNVELEKQLADSSRELDWALKQLTKVEEESLKKIEELEKYLHKAMAPNNVRNSAENKPSDDCNKRRMESLASAKLACDKEILVLTRASAEKDKVLAAFEQKANDALEEVDALNAKLQAKETIFRKMREDENARSRRTGEVEVGYLSLERKAESLELEVASLKEELETVQSEIESEAWHHNIHQHVLLAALAGVVVSQAWYSGCLMNWAL